MSCSVIYEGTAPRYAPEGSQPTSKPVAPKGPGRIPQDSLGAHKVPARAVLEPPFVADMWQFPPLKLSGKVAGFSCAGRMDYGVRHGERLGQDRILPRDSHNDEEEPCGCRGCVASAQCRLRRFCGIGQRCH